jgi:hypothetical protein
MIGHVAQFYTFVDTSTGFAGTSAFHSILKPDLFDFLFFGRMRLIATASSEVAPHQPEADVLVPRAVPRARLACTFDAELFLVGMILKRSRCHGGKSDP